MAPRIAFINSVLPSHCPGGSGMIILFSAQEDS